MGLALSYALSVTSLLGSLVTSFTDTEKELVSVERVGQYLRDLEEEPQDGTLLVGVQEAFHLRFAFLRTTSPA